MQDHFDFYSQMLNMLLHKISSNKINFTHITKWHDSHPYYRLNYYNGIQISQVIGVYFLLNKDYLSIFDNIVEIGSYNGGLSSYIFDTKKPDSKFVSYDIVPEINETKKNRDDIDFRIGDCFEQPQFDEIVSLIQSPGRTLMICDGGFKTREFNDFSVYLKKDDVIMLHDYKQEDQSFFEAKEYWQWPYSFETCYEDIKEAIERNGLDEYYNKEANFFMWGSFIKR